MNGYKLRGGKPSEIQFKNNRPIIDIIFTESSLRMIVFTSRIDRSSPKNIYEGIRRRTDRCINGDGCNEQCTKTDCQEAMSTPE